MSATSKVHHHLRQILEFIYYTFVHGFEYKLSSWVGIDIISNFNIFVELQWNKLLVILNSKIAKQIVTKDFHIQQ